MDFRQRLTLAATLILAALPAWAMEGRGSPSDSSTLYSIGGTLLASAFTTEPRTFLSFAKDDATSFVASNGAIRGAQFERAVRDYHSHSPAPHMSDDQLAQAIAAH